MTTKTTATHPLATGSRVKIFNGGKLEGWATIKAACSTEHDYHVQFEGDTDRGFWRRTVMPQWQEEGFEPLSSDTDRERTAQRLVEMGVYTR
jgi:hypothetical protein